MKWYLVLVLSLVLLLSGCSASPVKTPLQQSDIDAIPVATDAMTEEELKLKVQVQVSTGQLLTAYEGIIVEGQ